MTFHDELDYIIVHVQFRHHVNINTIIIQEFLITYYVMYLLKIVYSLHDHLHTERDEHNIRAVYIVISKFILICNHLSCLPFT